MDGWNGMAVQCWARACEREGTCDAELENATGLFRRRPPNHTSKEMPQIVSLHRFLITIFAKYVHRELRNATFEGEKMPTSITFSDSADVQVGLLLHSCTHLAKYTFLPNSVVFSAIYPI